MNIASTLNPLLTLKRESIDRFSTVQMIFFDGEEAMIEWSDTDSIYGAKHLAEKWSNTMMTITNDDMSTSHVSPIHQIDAMILLDLLGTKDATVLNSHPETQWVWDRLARIHERLGILRMLSPFMLTRIKKGDYMFPSGGPRLSATAVQV